MIEIRKRETGEHDYDLFIDEVRINDEAIEVGWSDITIRSEDSFRRHFSRSTFADLGRVDASLQFGSQISDTVRSIWFSGIGKITYYVATSLRDWKKPYTFVEYGDEIVACAKTLPNMETQRYESEDDAIECTYLIENAADMHIVAEFDRISEIIKGIYQSADENLRVRASANSLTTVFDFPEAVRVPCEQYLLYFIEFLRDSGVEATSNLSHDTGKVLFTITPENKDEGLEKIRAALDVYLALASTPLDDDPNYDDHAFKVQRLAANIYHLRAQLSLAQATLEAQRFTIQHLAGGEIVRNSLVSANTAARKEEEILGGLVSITPLEGKGFKVNLPQLYRWLRDFFTDSDE